MRIAVLVGVAFGLAAISLPFQLAVVGWRLAVVKR